MHLNRLLCKANNLHIWNLFIQMLLTKFWQPHSDIRFPKSEPALSAVMASQGYQRPPAWSTLQALTQTCSITHEHAALSWQHRFKDCRAFMWNTKKTILIHLPFSLFWNIYLLIIYILCIHSAIVFREFYSKNYGRNEKHRRASQTKPEGILKQKQNQEKKDHGEN